MARFLKGDTLNSEVGKILEKAEEQLILISPYIKLYDRYASILKTKISNPKLQITVVFGKNENDITKSIKKDDVEFFKQFPNIEIRYEKRLHAKYYANEKASILTSMNLYSFSQENNIEAGILSQPSVIGNISNKINDDSFDNESKNYFDTVICQSELLYKKEPVFSKGTLGLGKKLIDTDVKVDLISDFFDNQDKYNKKSVKEVLIQESNNKIETQTTGYCIRTGKEIPFNLEKPFEYEAYKLWEKFGNEDYPEKYCHFSGEKSNGETCFSKPILKKNWKKAKEVFEF